MARQKFTVEDLLDVFHADPTTSTQDIADQYGVCVQTVVARHAELLRAKSADGVKITTLMANHGLIIPLRLGSTTGNGTVAERAISWLASAQSA